MPFVISTTNVDLFDALDPGAASGPTGRPMPPVDRRFAISCSNITFEPTKSVTPDIR